METEEKNTDNATAQNKWNSNENRSGRVIAGLVIVAIGSFLLADKLGVMLPNWLLSWPMFLIGMGLFIGAKHSFRNPAWIVLVIIGSVLLADNYFLEISIRHLIWPLAIITVGFVIMFKPKVRSRHWGGRYNSQHYRYTTVEATSEDYLDSVSIFGSVKKNVISKDFKGGESVCVFGGSELNLTQANINGRVVIELVMVFGGTTLLVPANWQIQTGELVSIFGGIEDKRPVYTHDSVDSDNVLVLKGTCLFGGITLKSY